MGSGVRHLSASAFGGFLLCKLEQVTSLLSLSFLIYKVGIITLLWHKEK